MKGRRKLLVCAAACAGLLAVSTAMAAPILIDLETATSTTMAGYTRVLQTNRFDNSTPVTLSTGEKVAWKDYCSAGTSNRTTATYLPGASALLMDFNGFGTGIVETLQVRNLVPGRYNLTLYAVDVSNKDKVTQFDIDQNSDSVNDAQVVIDWKNLSEISKTTEVNVSAAGVLSITVQRYGMSAGGAFNGFDLVAVPEPVTLLVLLVGAGLMVVRRR